MEEKELNYEEIVKALECMAGITQRDCDNCSFMINKFCSDMELSTATLNLIHRLQNEVSQWKSKAEHIEEVYGKVKQQSVKDTEKEILAMFDDRNYITERDLKEAIAKRYGVE